MDNQNDVVGEGRGQRKGSPQIVSKTGSCNGPGIDSVASQRKGDMEPKKRVKGKSCLLHEKVGLHLKKEGAKNEQGHEKSWDWSESQIRKEKETLLVRERDRGRGDKQAVIGLRE